MEAEIYEFMKVGAIMAVSFVTLLILGCVAIKKYEDRNKEKDE